METRSGDASFADRLLEVVRAQSEIVKRGFDLGGVLPLVADRAWRLVGGAGAIVELVEGEEMVYRAASGIAEKQLGLRLDRRTSLSGLSVERREPLICEDSETDPRVDRAACRRVGLRSMIVLPLFHGDQTVGVLKVVSPDVAAFELRDTDLLALMTEVIAASLFHAASHESGELFHRATHDALTSLPNRALFFDRFRHDLAVAGRSATKLGVLHLDLDGLKPINDRHGHRAGDAAIVELARRAAPLVRQSDTLARIGGDEFGVLLARVDGRDGVELFARRLAEQIDRPFPWEGQELSFGASIGAALFPDDARDVDALLEQADRAMYANKRRRKGSGETPGSREPSEAG